MRAYTFFGLWTKVHQIFRPIGDKSSWSSTFRF